MRSRCVLFSIAIVANGRMGDVQRLGGMGGSAGLCGLFHIKTFQKCKR